VTPGRDDDALSWSGDDDPTLDVGTPGAPDTADEVDDVDDETVVDAAPVALPAGFTAVGQGSGEVGRIESDGSVLMPGDREPMSNAALISLGVFGGVYLLYVVGWIIAVQRDTITLPSLFAEIMYQFGEFLAIASPALWIGAVLLLTNGRKPIVRLLWLVLGLLVVAPWPFILGGLA
jgi:hypothetical protein